MERRNSILISIAVVLAIAVGIASFLFFRRVQKNPEVQQDSVEQEDNSRTGLPSSGGGSSTRDNRTGTEIVREEPTLPPPPANQVHGQVASDAKKYAERFGSFSSHGNFANLVTLKAASTPQMQEWIDNIVTQYATDNVSTTEYNGTLTKALGARVLLVDEAEGFAIVEVDTLRREEKGNMIDTYYQIITIEMMRGTKNQWLLDGAYWGDIQ